MLFHKVTANSAKVKTSKVVIKLSIGMVGILRWQRANASRSVAARGDSPQRATATITRERDVAALRQLREKDRAPTLLFTRDVAVPTGLR